MDHATAGGLLRPRLLFLLLLLAGAVGYALYVRSRPEAHDIRDDYLTEPLVTQLAPWDMDLPAGSVPPAVTPEFDVQVELRRGDPQTWLYFFVTERHGFLADGVYVEFWHQYQDPETGKWIADSEPVPHLCRARLEFGAVLEDHTVITELERANIPDVGTSENWGAKVAGVLRVAARGPSE